MLQLPATGDDLSSRFFSSDTVLDQPKRPAPMQNVTPSGHALPTPVEAPKVPRRSLNRVAPKKYKQSFGIRQVLQQKRERGKSASAPFSATAVPGLTAATPEDSGDRTVDLEVDKTENRLAKCGIDGPLSLTTPHVSSSAVEKEDRHVSWADDSELNSGLHAAENHESGRKTSLASTSLSEVALPPLRLPVDVVVDEIRGAKNTNRIDSDSRDTDTPGKMPVVQSSMLYRSAQRGDRSQISPASQNGKSSLRNSQSGLVPAQTQNGGQTILDFDVASMPMVLSEHAFKEEECYMAWFRRVVVKNRWATWFTTFYLRWL